VIDWGGPWWEQLPVWVAFDLEGIPEAVRPFYRHQGRSFAIQILADGGCALPVELQSPGMFLLIGYYAYTHKIVCSALN
jgi:hypothetical protein